MRWFRAAGRYLLFAILAAGSAAITVASLAYFNPDEVAPFVVEKLPLPWEDVWLGALKIHVVAASLALPSCLLLTTNFLLKKAPRFHRWLGRITGANVLLALVPSGSYLALFAKGGLWSTLGFLLSGAIIAVGMVQSIKTARRGDFVAHRMWTLHVLAQMSVAVSSRVMLYAFNAVDWNHDSAYLISLWVPVIGSALLVTRLAPWRKHETHSRRPRRPVLQPGLGRAASL